MVWAADDIEEDEVVLRSIASVEDEKSEMSGRTEA